MNQPQHSELFTEAVSTLRNYPEDASSAALERITDALIDLDGEDVSERSFTDRLLTDKAIWLDHAADSLFTHPEVSLEIQRLIREVKECREDSMFVLQADEEYNLGCLVFKAVMDYAEGISNE